MQTLKNGDEIKVGNKVYRVIDEELFEVKTGSPPSIGNVFPVTINLDTLPRLKPTSIFINDRYLDDSTSD